MSSRSEPDIALGGRAKTGRTLTFRWIAQYEIRHQS